MLATIKTVDFIYVCDGHLKDPGFATQVVDTTDNVGGGTAKLGLSTEEIAKVKQEWEERQKKRKQEKEKAKEDEKKEKEADEKESGKAATKDKEVEKPKSPGALTPPSTTSSPPPPTHERYTLHRDMFALRLAEHRRRRQIAQAKELAPRLPGAPRESLQPPS